MKVATPTTGGRGFIVLVQGDTSGRGGRRVYNIGAGTGTWLGGFSPGGPSVALFTSLHCVYLPAANAVRGLGQQPFAPNSPAAMGAVCFAG
jgi:hypothetical protein